jgi:predicted ATPase
MAETVKSWTTYHFHDTSTEAKVKQTGDLNDNRALRPDAANLAAFLYRLQETEPAVFRNLAEVIRMVAPFFSSFNLRPNPLNPRTIRLEWQEIGSDSYFDAHSLSDGTLRFISLATLLLQPELPPTLLLDEPELGLHPYAITVLADLLRAAATRTQVIVSTQSVTLVNQFAPEDLIVVDRIEGESIFRRLTADEIASWLDDYALGELWEKNVLGGSALRPPTARPCTVRAPPPGSASRPSGGAVPI